MSVRRRIGWAVAALFGPLLIAFAAAPYLVDVESYKPSLIEAVKDATGRELVIDGPMKLSVFPVPRPMPRWSVPRVMPFSMAISSASRSG